MWVSKKYSEKTAVTLVELLIAVSIFAFIISSSYLLLRSFNQVYRRGVNLGEYRQRVRLLSRIFSKDIASIYKKCNGSEKDLVFFCLEVRGDRFYASEVHYHIDSDKIYRSLERNTDYDFSTEGQKELLVDGLLWAGFSYYDGFRWRADWQIDDLPEEVKLTVSWKDLKKKNEFIFKVMSR